MNVQDHQKIAALRSSDGIITIFGVSAEDKSLADLVALHGSDGVVRLAGSLELLPALFGNALGSLTMDDLFSGSIERYSMLSTGRAQRVTTPILDLSIRWAELLDDVLDDSGVVAWLQGFVKIEYPLDEGGPFSALQVWIGPVGDPTLEELFTMFVFNAMANGDARQSVSL